MALGGRRGRQQDLGFLDFFPAFRLDLQLHQPIHRSSSLLAMAAAPPPPSDLKDVVVQALGRLPSTLPSTDSTKELKKALDDLASIRTALHGSSRPPITSFVISRISSRAASHHPLFHSARKRRSRLPWTPQTTFRRRLARSPPSRHHDLSSSGQEEEGTRG